MEPSNLMIPLVRVKISKAPTPLVQTIIQVYYDGSYVWGVSKSGQMWHRKQVGWWKKIPSKSKQTAVSDAASCESGENFHVFLGPKEYEKVLALKRQAMELEAAVKSTPLGSIIKTARSSSK